MKRKRSEVDIRYDQFLRRRKGDQFQNMRGADYNTIYEEVYGTSDLEQWFENRYAGCRERYERENAG